jgi:S1-C subfamily serine protease
VAATSEHPAGLIVNGWGAAGTGLRDGDIIVSLGGGPPSSVDEVIAAVAGAYRRKVYAVSGRIWRAGETIDVSVELPFPEEDDSRDAAGSSSSQRMLRSMGAP